MRIPILAAFAALLAAAPAFSAPLKLASGRTFVAPAAVPGCTAPTTTSPANGVTAYVMTCKIEIEGKPTDAIVHMTIFGPTKATNRDFFSNLLKRLGKSDQLDDPRLGPKPRVIQTSDAKGTFLCYAMDDPANRTGGEVCSLEGEPGVRVTALVATTDAQSGVRIMNVVLGASVLRSALRVTW